MEYLLTGVITFVGLGLAAALAVDGMVVLALALAGGTVWLVARRANDA